jgi:hypothetical protein
VGLCFRKTAGGVMSWSFRFRDPTTGAPARYTIGRYPDIGLAAARSRADELRAVVASGGNPVETKRKARKEAPNRTFQALADRYLTEYARRKKRTHAADESNLKLHVLPEWGNRSYQSITRGDVIELAESLVTAASR